MFFRNKISYQVLLFFSAVAVNLIFCSMNPSQYAGGSASEGEAHTLSGKISYENGAAGAELPVFLKEVEINSGGASADTHFVDTTDQSGYYCFKGISRGIYSMSCQGDDGNKKGLISRIEVNRDIDLDYNDKIILRETKTVKGRLVTDQGTAPSSVRVVLPATGEEVTPDSDGFFYINSVIYDQTICAFIHENTVNYLIFSIKQDYNDTVYLRDVRFQENDSSEFTRTSDGLFRHDADIEKSFVIFTEIYDSEDEPSWYKDIINNGRDFFSVSYFNLTETGFISEVDDNGKPIFLLDNFEDSDSYSELTALNPDAVWKFKTDSQPVNTALFPAGIYEDFKKAVVDSSVKGKTLHFGAVIGDNSADRYASVYVPLVKDDGQYADFTMLSNLRFYVKGTGSLRIMFWTRKAEEDYSGEYSREQLSSVVELPDYWYLATINLMDIVPPPGSPQEADSLIWEDAREEVSALEFSLEGEPGDSVELFIDEIYLSGVEPSDIY